MKYILVISLLLSIFPAFAQKKTATDKAMASACECINKTDKKLNKEGLKIEVEKCVTQAMLANLQGLVDEYGIDMTDEKSAYEMGKQLGIKLAAKCPAFIELFANSELLGKETNQTSEAAESEFTVGTLKEIIIEDVIYLVIVEANGDTRNFVLYTYFNGASEFVQSLDLYKNKEVKIGWTTQKVFDKKSNTFVDKKIVTALQLW